jgi:anti-sigma regulatory factor (Ser/Thr protein kinase)
MIGARSLTARTRVPASPRSAARCRQWALRRLTLWPITCDGYDVELVVGELVGNAVLHGRPGQRVLLELVAERDRLRVTVANPLVSALPQPSGPTAPDDLAESGRGLFLVDHLALAFTSRIVGEQHVAVAEFAAQRSASRLRLSVRRAPRLAWSSMRIASRTD